MTTLLTEKLGERATRDPFAALLLQQLTSQAETVEDPDAPDPRLERAARTIARLRAELAAANTMATQVARVLGACTACWGLDRFCGRCRGAGAPGSHTPDIDALVDWIGPALRRGGISLSTTRPAE